MTAVWTGALAALASYLLGALPFSQWIARWRGVDLRQVGSGNPGATNVARSLGARWGALALLLDLGKGVAAGALTAGVLGAPLILAACAVLGHNWSVWLRFRGGKGVATTLGVLAVAAWPAALATAGVWAGLVLLTRKVSVGSVIALLLAPLFLWALERDGALVAVFAALGVLAAVRHRDNIRRLLAGREHGVGLAKRR